MVSKKCLLVTGQDSAEAIAMRTVPATSASSDSAARRDRPPPADGSLSRRAFPQNSGLAGGGLLPGPSAPPAAAALGGAAGARHPARARPGPPRGPRPPRQRGGGET